MKIDSPKLCAKCGYELSGIGSRGNCPECGEPFNTITGKGVKNSEFNSSHDERLFRRVRTLALVAGGVLVVVVAAYLQFVAGSSNAFWKGLVFAVMVFLAAATSYMYEND